MTTTAQWIATHAVSFGDVRFFPIGNGGWPEWVRDPVVSSKQIPGTGYGPARVKRQVIAFRPPTATYDIWLTSDDYARMDAMQQTSATLTLTAGTTKQADRQMQELGVLYDVLDGVILSKLDTPMARVGDLVRCNATFERTT